MCPDGTAAPALPAFGLAESATRSTTVTTVSTQSSTCSAPPRKSMKERLAARIGSIPTRSRYHRFPRRIQDDYMLSDKVLGKGSGGEVRVATSKAGGRKVAVKFLDLELISSSKLEQLEAEVENFLTMDHPYVARLYDVYRSAGEIQIVMECMEGGDLLERVRKEGHFSEAQASESLHQMLMALAHVHGAGVVHRDLKLEHFMYSRPGGQLKLIDFGFSRAWSPLDGSMRCRCGTLAYCAPEVMKKSYTSQCDIWSMGIIGFVLMTGQLPFPRVDRMPDQHVIDTEMLLDQDKLKGLSAGAASFISSLLELDPQKRPTALTALEHLWVAQGIRAAGPLSCGVVRALRDFGSASKFRRCCMHLLARTVSSTEAQSVEQAFISMDSSGRGVLTLADLRLALAEDDVEEEEIWQIFQALDQNSDHEVQFSDFLAAMVDSEIDLGDTLVSSAFQKFDMSGRGFVTKKCVQEIIGDTFEGECVEELAREVVSRKSNRISRAEFAAFVRGEETRDVPRIKDGLLPGPSRPGSSRMRRAIASLSHLRAACY